MAPTSAILSTASTTPLLTTRHEWPLKQTLHLPRELSSDVATSSSSSQIGTNMIALIVVIVALLTLTLSSVAAGVYHKYSYPRLNHQKTSTTPDFHDLPIELPDDHVCESDRENEGVEEKEELHSLEREEHHPINTNNNQIRLCIAQAVRVYPPGSASMVDIRNSGPGAWYSLHGLPNSRSVRDVSTLPDLSSARAMLSRRSDGVLGRRGKEAGPEYGGFAFEQPMKARESTTRTVMPSGENGKGLRQALKKRISTPRFGFQGGSVRELVRSIGF